MKLSATIKKRLLEITAKRPATVIKHILQHGYITSEELEQKYGYKHPPRAIRDVREQGINIETFRVKSSAGKSIAAYRFGSPIFIENTVSPLLGRTVLSQALKKALIEHYGSKCFIYQQTMDEKLLQVDHRIPYSIGGEADKDNIDHYMLLSPSANRAKSWTCEHCPNWASKNIDTCLHCFWAHPEDYTHISCKEERRIIISFTGNEIEDYNKLIALTGQENAEQHIKTIIQKYLNENTPNRIIQ